MKTIYKYLIQTVDEQKIMIHEGADFLSVMIQDGHVCVWAEVDTNNPQAYCTLWVVGTGNPMPDACNNEGNHLGSVIDGSFVWHVYHD